MGKTIVVADDEPDILKCVTFRLSKRGYEVLACGDRLSAPELVKNRKPDLVILDVKMPVLNGTEACKRKCRPTIAYSSRLIPVSYSKESTAVWA